MRRRSQIKYNRKGILIEVKVIEQGSQVQKFKSDSKNYARMMQTIEEKYGFIPTIKREEAPKPKQENEKNPEKKVDWLKGFWEQSKDLKMMTGLW